MFEWIGGLSRKGLVLDWQKCMNSLENSLDEKEIRYVANLIIDELIESLRRCGEHTTSISQIASEYQAKRKSGSNYDYHVFSLLWGITYSWNKTDLIEYRKFLENAFRFLEKYGDIKNYNSLQRAASESSAYKR